MEITGNSDEHLAGGHQPLFPPVPGFPEGPGPALRPSYPSVTFTDEELADWYEQFRIFGAHSNLSHWDGAHTAPPASLTVVRRWVEYEGHVFGETLPVTSVAPVREEPDEVQALVAARIVHGPEPGGPADNKGSRLHNLWHLIHGR